MGIGVATYFLAESLVSQNVASPGDHDILLANRLGFIHAPVVGLWLGWLQRSWQRAAIGAVIGIIIGFIYMALCGDSSLGVAEANLLSAAYQFQCNLIASGE